MDVSADLRELGRTPVTVVCAGVKSILDISKTLEYLVGLGYVDSIIITVIPMLDISITILLRWLHRICMCC